MLGGSRPKSNQFIYSGWYTPVDLVWWKSTQGFLIFRVNEVKIAYLDQVHWHLTFDLERISPQNLISSSTPSGAPLYQVWWKSTQGFLRFRVNEGKIAYLDQVHWPLTLDVGWISPQNLISSSTPGGAPLYQVWWKSTRGSWDFALTSVKNSIFRPNSLTLGGSRPKSNQFIDSWWYTPVPSLMKIHPGVLEISR